MDAPAEATVSSGQREAAYRDPTARDLERALARTQLEAERLKAALAHEVRARVRDQVARRAEEEPRATDSLAASQLTDLQLEELPLAALLETRRELGDDHLDESVILDHVLRERMAQDPDVLAAVLDRFATNPDDHLVALLGSFPHPDTERLAVDLAASTDPAARLAAYDLLDHFEHVSPTTHAALLDQLEVEQSSDVIAAALYALPHGVVPPDLNRRTREILHRAAANSEAQVRARAAIVLGMGPVGDGDLDVLLSGVTDPAIEARVSAIAALRNYRGSQASSVKAALRARMNDALEAPSVRRAAWTMLASFTLAQEEYDEWKTLKHALDAEGEAAADGR